jgi:hypothetical protein
MLKRLRLLTAGALIGAYVTAYWFVSEIEQHILGGHK